MTLTEAFVLLQVLDLITTLVGIRMGGTELNPFIAWLMQVTAPGTGLVLAKVIGFGLGGYFVWKQKARLIRRINYFFALLVAWNSAVIIAAIA